MQCAHMCISGVQEPRQPWSTAWHTPALGRPGLTVPFTAMPHFRACPTHGMADMGTRIDTHVHSHVPQHKTYTHAVSAGQGQPFSAPGHCESLPMLCSRGAVLRLTG